MHALATLKANKEKIIDNWMKRLREEFPIIKEHEKSAIENDVPHLLDAIIEYLSGEKNEKITKYSRRHGYKRANFKEYSLHHIIKEYNYLKMEILHLLDEDERASARERDIILSSVDQSIEEAAEVYFRIKQGVQIDARKVAEKKASDLQLEDRNREEFIHSLSHDLNNPINNIKACVELIETGLEVGDVSQVLRILKSSINQAQMLIEDFLEVGNISSNEKLPIKKEKVEIVEDIRNEIEIYKLSHKGDIQLSSNREKIMAHLDLNLVLRSLNNLINNAMKHGKGDTPINVECNLKDNQLEIAVHNQGKVIPEEAIGNLFNRYYQEDKSKKGWGIGLAFVNEVVSAHGGDIQVESNPEVGTRFTMYFPQ